MTTPVAPAMDALEQRRAWPVAVVALALGVVLLAGVALVARGESAPAPPSETAGVPARQDLIALREAVASNPEDLAARLALAHHHFDRSDYDLALAQYLAVLDRQPDHVRALARAGWIAFEGGDNATAERLVTAALDRRPQDAEALWFLAHVRLYGRDDPDGARAPLDALLARDDLSDEFRLQVRELRHHARR